MLKARRRCFTWEAYTKEGSRQDARHGPGGARRCNRRRPKSVIGLHQLVDHGVAVKTLRSSATNYMGILVVLYSLGRSLMDPGHLSQAITILRPVSDLDPTNGCASVALACGSARALSFPASCHVPAHLLPPTTTTGFAD